MGWPCEAQSSPRVARESWGLRSSHCRAEETSPRRVSAKRRGSLRCLPPLEVRPSSIAPDPAESRGAPPPPQDPSPLSRAAPGKSGLHARGEGERVLALESRDPRGVRPRLEGKSRTPLSSRVATRVSWSPLSVASQRLPSSLRALASPDCLRLDDRCVSLLSLLFHAALQSCAQSKLINTCAND